MTTANTALRRYSHDVADEERVLLDRLLHITWIASSDGACQWLNAFGLSYFGVPFEKLAGLRWTSYAHPEDVSHVLSMIVESGRSGAHGYAEQRLRRADGEYRWHAISATPLVENGHVVLVGTAVDIQARRDAELHHARAERLTAIAALAAGLAHQLNNWLAVIVANESWLRTHVSHLDAEALDKIRHAAQRITNLVGQLGGFPRVDATQRLAVDRALRAMTGLVEDTVGSDIQVELDLCASNAIVACDVLHLRQIVLTVVERTREATEPTDRITLRTSSESDHICLDITDHTTHFSPFVEEHLFEPFSTTIEPAGLSLHSMRQLVLALRGTVALVSLPDGMTFRVTLPRVHLDSPLVPRPPNGVLLIVDDMPDIRDALARVARRLGYAVETASGGEAALALIAKTPIDIVLSDISMPGMNGFALAERVRDRGIPVLLMTAYDDTRAVPGGAQVPILRKPFSSDELAATLATVHGPR